MKWFSWENCINRRRGREDELGDGLIHSPETMVIKKSLHFPEHETKDLHSDLSGMQS